MFPVSAPSGRTIDRLILASVIPDALSKPMEWRKLHTFSVLAELRTNRTIWSVIEFLMRFHPPALRDVTAQFRIFNQDIVYAMHGDGTRYEFVGVCRKLKEALYKFPRHHLSFLGSPEYPPRKYLWMRELGQLFPAFRDLKQLTVVCESSERSAFQKSSAIEKHG